MSTITSVKKVKEGHYLINEVLLVYNIDYDTDQEKIICDIDFEESKISEDAAMQIVHNFIMYALKNILKNYLHSVRTLV